MRLVSAVVCGTCGADAGVAGGEDHRDTARPELGVQIADGAGVGLWDGLLVLAVAGGDDLREFVLVELEDALEEVEEGLVVVFGGVWRAVVWDELAAAAGGEFGDWQGGADAEEVLQVEVCFAAVLRRGLVVEAAVEGDHGEVLPRREGGVFLEEFLQVVVARVLLEEAGEGDFAAALGVGHVAEGVVQVGQAAGGDGVLAVVQGAGGDGLEDHTAGLEEGWFGSHGGAVGAHAAEACSRLDHVDVLGHGRGHGVLQGAQDAGIARVVVGGGVPQEVGVEQRVGLVDGRAEVDPVGVLLVLGDAGGLQPAAHGGSAVITGHEQLLHLAIGAVMVAVVGVAGGRHVQQGLLEAGLVLLFQGNPQADRLVGGGRAIVSPA